MRNARDVDVLILGAGCAGLSLAIRLAEMGEKCPITHIIERRSEYSNDRTWCFWGTKNAQLRDLAAKQWSTVGVSNADVALDLNSARFPYCMIAAADFYRHALAIVASNPRITVQLDRTVSDIPKTQINKRWNVPLESEVIRATNVIDTRPRSESPPRVPVLWQSFLGAEIQCDEAVFNPNRIELMNFAPPRADRIAFTYILPITAHRALIEFTLFAPAVHSAPMLQPELDEALALHTRNHPFVVSRTEYGVLPMGLPRASRSRSPHFANVGLNAGAARASTGYAFQRIQRWATQCAASLAQSGTACEHAPEPYLMAAMDHIFLSVIRNQPDRAPQLFMALFERAGIERTARFLSDCAGPADIAAIVLSLPSLPFLAGLRRVVTERCARAFRLAKI